MAFDIYRRTPSRSKLSPTSPAGPFASGGWLGAGPNAGELPQVLGPHPAVEGGVLGFAQGTGSPDERDSKGYVVVPATLPLRPEPRSVAGIVQPLLVPAVPLPRELLPQRGIRIPPPPLSLSSPSMAGTLSPLASPTLPLSPPSLQLGALAQTPAAIARQKRQSAEQEKKRRKGLLLEGAAGGGAVGGVATSSIAGAPTVQPSSAADPVKEDRRRRRLLRNRVSAQQARERKKSHIMSLQQHVDDLEARTAELEQLCTNLVQENEELRQTVKQNIGKRCQNTASKPIIAFPESSNATEALPATGIGDDMREGEKAPGAKGRREGGA